MLRLTSVRINKRVLCKMARLILRRFIGNSFKKGTISRWKEKRALAHLWMGPWPILRWWGDRSIVSKNVGLLKDGPAMRYSILWGDVRYSQIAFCYCQWAVFRFGGSETVGQTKLTRYIWQLSNSFQNNSIDRFNSAGRPDVVKPTQPSRRKWTFTFCALRKKYWSLGIYGHIINAEQWVFIDLKSIFGD